LIIARKTTTWVLALGLLLALCVLTIGKPSMATEPPVGPDVDPVLVPGNPTCEDRGYANELKIEGVDLDNKEYTDGTLTVTISNLVHNSEGEPVLFDWTSNIGVDEVLVKASNAANAYIYNPPPEIKVDDKLFGPENKGISHINFCYDGETVVPQPLTATKTAEGSYERKITWDLTKTVTPDVTPPVGPTGSYSFSGLAEQSFNYTWNVDATKTLGAPSNFKVAGVITINNPNGFNVPFSVTDELDDGTPASVDCNSTTEGAQDSGTVAADGSVECTYSASPTNKDAQKNTAHVTSDNPDVGGADPEAAIEWKEKLIGDTSVKLGDTSPDDTPPINHPPETISDSKSLTFPKAFTCPPDRASYNADRLYYKTITNEATLEGTETHLKETAEVKFTCKYPWVGETATGAGTRYVQTNWFMYTPFATNVSTTTVNLMAGQTYDAGDIKLTRSGGNTVIETTLDNGFRWANVSQNLKIQYFGDKAPTKFVSPGSFANKYTVPQGTVTYPVTITNTTPPANALFTYYGIHADVERFAP
jgi:hypothetical protein